MNEALKKMLETLAMEQIDPYEFFSCNFNEHNYDSLLVEDVNLDLPSDYSHYREWHVAGWAPIP